MRIQFVFLTLIVVNCTKSSKTANNQTPLPPKTCDKAVVCNCNLNQDYRFSEAINSLETKLEHLITLVNKTLQPKPTGKGKELRRPI